MQWEGEIIEEELAKLLENVRSGDIPVDKAVRLFKNFQFEDIGFAKIDHHRSLRKGFPEVIFGPGKTPAQIISIAKRMRVLGQPVFITRIDSNSAKSCLEALPESQFIPEAQAVVVGGIEKESLIPGVLLLSAGTSDIRVAEEAALTAKLLGSEVVKIFLNKGANPLIEDDHGKTALVHALLKNHLQSAQLLYRVGADLNINLLYAAKRGFPEMVTYLLKQGADHSWITEKQETPLILASLAKNHECAEILLKQGTLDRSKFIECFKSCCDEWRFRDG